MIESSSFINLSVDIETRAEDALSTLGSVSEVPPEKHQRYTERLSWELEYIRNAGLTPYISTATELVDRAYDLGVAVGPGRGSSPSSLVLYLLGITQVDPIANGLIVERWFSNPTIEIDVEWHRRKELIDYLWGRYGFEHTAYISTYKRDKESGEILSRGVHAASYAISSTPIMDLMPTWTAADGRLVVDAEREDVEARGIGIFTILGMKQLSVIGETVARIVRSKPDFAIKRIPEEDATTMGLFKTGNTADIFQFDSQNMRETLTRAQAENRGDLAIVSAVHRPPFVVDGMMSELIDRMVAKNNLPESAEHMFPEDMLSEVSGVKDVLAASFGLMIFQEQFLEIVRRLSGW
jgi:error-prone DNA polymerase